jgi:hypothetical protein
MYAFTVLYMMMIIIIIIRHRYGYSIKSYESGLTGVSLITRPVAERKKDREREISLACAYAQVEVEYVEY